MTDFLATNFYVRLIYQLRVRDSAASLVPVRNLTSIESKVTIVATIVSYFDCTFFARRGQVTLTYIENIPKA